MSNQSKNTIKSEIIFERICKCHGLFIRCYKLLPLPKDEIKKMISPLNLRFSTRHNQFALTICGETLLGNSFDEVFTKVIKTCLAIYNKVFSVNLKTIEEAEDYLKKYLNKSRYELDTAQEIIFTDEQEKVFKEAVQRLRKEMYSAIK